MQKPVKKYLWFIPILLLAILITLRHFVPEPVNWEPSFSAQRKIPYGCSVVNDLMKDIFPDQVVEFNYTSLYVSLGTNNRVNQNFIIVNDYFQPDELDLDVLLGFVSRGNNLFISSLAFPDKLSDTICLETNNSLFDTSLFKKANESLNLRFLPEGSDSSFSFSRRFPDHYFTDIGENISILGSDQHSRPNFISAKFGEGYIFMHCQPMAFTNYHILYGSYQYACTALSVLPVRNTIWDQYYKSDRFVNMSPVRFILSSDALRSAWYLLTFTIFLYLIFGSRRKQRPIPVINPPENTSLEFIKSIGKLYFKSQNHTDIARKKVMYLREFLRNRYSFRTTEANEENIRFLTEKSGAGHEIVDEMLRRAAHIERSFDINGDELMRMNDLVERFYKNCK